MSGLNPKSISCDLMTELLLLVLPKFFDPCVTFQRWHEFHEWCGAHKSVLSLIFDTIPVYITCLILQIKKSLCGSCVCIFGLCQLYYLALGLLNL